MFHYFTIKFHLSFFASFRFFFALNFSIRFDLVIFASKRNKAKRNSSLFFRFFSLNFRFALIFSLNFAYFTFNYASDFWCFASKWITWNQAFFSLPSKTKFSLQKFQIPLPKRKWGRTLGTTTFVSRGQILGQNPDKRFFLLVIHSHVYSFALRFLFLKIHATSYFFSIQISGSK